MTHNDLCAVAVRWLKRPLSQGGHGCQIAVSECQSELGGGEIPDAIGYRAKGHHDGTVVVECKVSRSDYLADAKKPHRANPIGGMGKWRYYMAPAGLIVANELPQGWGLLEVNARGHVLPVAGPAAIAHQKHKQKEPPFITYEALRDAYMQFAHPNRATDRELSLLVRLQARIGDAEVLNRRLREAEGRAQRAALANEKLRNECRELRSSCWKASPTQEVAHA
jgi:hypothetical protein